MRVAMYDRLPIDDVARYRALADVQLLTRFRPLRDVPDLVLTTYTRPADTGAPIVSLSSHTRMFSAVTASSCWMPLRMWSTHDTTRWTLDRIRGALGASGGRVAVVGMGRVGRRVARALRRTGADVAALHHADSPRDIVAGLGGASVVSLHLADSPGWLDPYLASLDHAVVVNSAWSGLVGRQAMTAALGRGYVREYIVDGGAAWDVAGVIWTPRTAWHGPRSERLRPLVVERVIRAAEAGRLDAVARRVA